jgi:hypothetical protein
MFQAESPLAAVLAVLVFLALASVVAVAVGRLTNAAVGLFVLGAGSFALASRLETVREIAFGDGSLTLVAIETLFVAGLALAAAAAMFRFVGPLPDIHPRQGQAPESLWGRTALLSAAAGVVALPVVWILSKSPMTGQTIGAVFVGGMCAGLAARLWQPHAQPMLLFASPLVFGAMGHVLGAVLRDGTVADSYVSGELRGASMPMPLAYFSGTLMGVSFGLGWAKSFLHHEEEPVAVQS